MRLPSSRMSKVTLALIIGLLSVVLYSCGRLVYVEGTIHLVDYIDESDRSYSVDDETVEPGEELPIENSPVISLELSSELDEVVISDAMLATVGVQIDLDSQSGEIDLNLKIEVFISDEGEPQIWEDTPAFEFVVEHVQEHDSNYSESSYDLLDRFQDVIHTAEPVHLAMKASLTNVGEAGSYSGSIVVTLFDIYYEGHKEL